MKKSSIIFVGIVIVILGGFIWWGNGNAPVNAKDTSDKVFVVPKGATIRAIGNDLKEEGLIRDPVIFFLYIKKNNLDTSIQAGSYKLSPSMTLDQIIKTMQTGSIDVWITIPEGYRSEEVAETIAQVVDTYDDSWIRALKEHEGFLFPDTYLVPRDADVETIISIMRNNFNTKLNEAGIDPNDQNILDIVTMASLIEREAITDDEKPLIASVISNRLNEGMGLDIDATLQYITGKSGSWWEVPTGEERTIDSPYNTYRYAGLPPGPIANPGIEAIKAAVSPADTSYYYYIHDSSGKSHFATTLSEHNNNVNTYLR